MIPSLASGDAEGLWWRESQLSLSAARAVTRSHLPQHPDDFLAPRRALLAMPAVFGHLPARTSSLIACMASIEADRRRTVPEEALACIISCPICQYTSP